MKTISTIILLVAFFITFPAVAQKAQAPAKGGDSSGGGNMIEAGPATPSQIRALLNEIQTPLTYAFYHLQNKWDILRDESNEAFAVKEMKSKLFDGNGFAPVFERLAKLQYSMLEKGACSDSLGNPVDASVNLSVPNVICVSLERLAVKLNSENFFGGTIAIVAHEVSHFQGLNESEAAKVQKILQQDVQPAARWLYKQYPAQLKADLEKLKIFTKGLLDGISHGVLSPMDCSYAGIIYEQAQNMWAPYYDVAKIGLGFGSRSKMKALSEVFFRSNNLLMGCYPTVLHHFEEIVFDGRVTISLAEYGEKHGYGRPFPSGVITRVREGDHKAMTIETRRLLEAIEIAGLTQ